MIVVTGANGFIGSALIWEFNQKGIDHIVGVDPISTQERPGPLSKRKYSHLLDRDQLWDFLSKDKNQKEINWIIHLGAISSTTEKNWDFLLENNVLYSQKISDWCTLHGKNLIYASSAATYGSGHLGFDDEIDSELLQPLNLYGQSKVSFDRWMLKNPNQPQHWYGLKFFNVYGPNEYHKQGQASVVYHAFNQIKSSPHKLKLFKSYNSLYEDGKQMRDFVYVKDVTRWILELINNKPKNGIYNMGFGQAKTWLDLAHSVFQALNKEEKIEFIEVAEDVKKHYQYFTEANMNKWKQAKLSEPQWTLEKGVYDYVNEYLIKDNPWL